MHPNPRSYWFARCARARVRRRTDLSLFCMRECMRARQAHIEENINVFGFALTEREMIRIDELNRDRTSCMRGCSLAYTRRACTRPYAATHPRFSPLSFSLFCVRARA